MYQPDISSPSDACPASAVIIAMRLAKTPLAIADAKAPGVPIMFANEAFAELVRTDAASLVGLTLDELSGMPLVGARRGSTTRFELALKGANPMPVALSTASVLGPDGQPFCVLCSLVDARGEGADEAIARDADLLEQVAQAAGDLMRESAAAALVSGSVDADRTADSIAAEAVGRVTAADEEKAS